MRPVILKKINNSYIEPEEIITDRELMKAFSDFSQLESETIYFSAGPSQLKEILISKEAYYSI